MNQVVIGVGSNICPAENIAKAREEIRRSHRLVAESAFVETKPVGYADQSDFINGAFRIETELDYDGLKAWLLSTERALGRKRGMTRYGPRPIDLDIVVWNGKIVDDDFYERDFLRNAVLEVWPDLRV